MFLIEMKGCLDVLINRSYFFLQAGLWSETAGAYTHSIRVLRGLISNYLLAGPIA